MRLLPKILKANTVFIDQDKKVKIKANLFGQPLEDNITDDENDNTEEEAVDIVRQAEDEAAFVRRRAESNAQDIIQKAVEEAARITAEAEFKINEEAKEIRKRSHTEAYQQGIDAAVADGDAIRAEAEGIKAKAMQERDQLRLDSEPEMIALILSIVEKLLGDAIYVNPAVVVSLIRHGFASAGSTLSGKVVIRVSADDYEQVLENKDEIYAAAGGAADIEIIRDTSLGLLDCVIDTPFGGIDVSLTPQYEALRENLIFLMEHP